MVSFEVSKYFSKQLYLEVRQTRKILKIILIELTGM